MGGTANVEICWHGHACVQLGIAGATVLTDPALTGRLAHLRRHHRVDPASIRPPDVIVISHVHLDHLHLPSLRRFARDVTVFVPAGAGALLRRRGFADVRETSRGEVHDVGALKIQTVPAVHSSRRGPHSRVVAEAVGYVVRSAEAAVYFAGDTDLFDEMGTWGPIDVALLPIGGWGRTVGDGHLDPTSAVRAAQLVRARVVVPIHWGTYSPIGLRRPGWLDAPGQRFTAEMAAAGIGDVLHVLRPGATLALPTSPPTR